MCIFPYLISSPDLIYYFLIYIYIYIYIRVFNQLSRSPPRRNRSRSPRNEFFLILFLFLVASAPVSSISFSLLYILKINTRNKTKYLYRPPFWCDIPPPPRIRITRQTKCKKSQEKQMTKSSRGNVYLFFLNTWMC